MLEDCLGHGRILGMIQPDSHRPPGPTGAALYRVGCLGRVSSFSETDDGRYLITLTGLVRFTVSVELEMRRGYRRVRAGLEGFAADLLPEPALFDREALLAALRLYFIHRGFDANWSAIEDMHDDDFITTLSMVCPFEVAEKQALLEAPTQTDRAAILLALLRIAAHDQPPDDGAGGPRAS